MKKYLQLTALCVLMLSMIGCGIAGWAGNLFRNDETKVNVNAEYTALVNRRTAVLVSTHPYTLYHHPDAPLLIARAVSAQLAQHVDGIQLTHPDQVAAFQTDNPYWNTLTYNELIHKLDVQRLIFIDLSEYALHVPGNTHQWRGQATANVHVIETEADDTDKPAYSKMLRVQYPPNARVGVLGSDTESIQFALVSRLADRVGKLFHDHQEFQPK